MSKVEIFSLNSAHLFKVQDDSTLGAAVCEMIDGAATHEVAPRAGDQPQTAKALGLEVPATLLVRADDAIE